MKRTLKKTEVLTPPGHGELDCWCRPILRHTATGVLVVTHRHIIAERAPETIAHNAARYVGPPPGDDENDLRHTGAVR